MAAPVYDDISFDLSASFAKLKATLTQTFQGIPLANGSPFATPAIPRDSLTLGTGAGQFNTGSKFYSVSATGNTDYDLTTLVDPFGAAINLLNVRYFAILNFATTAGFNLTFDGTVTNAWLAPFSGVATAKLVIPPGWVDTAGTVHPGRVLLGGGSAAGLVTSSTSKVVRIAAGANTIPHAFWCIGVA